MAEPKDHLTIAGSTEPRNFKSMLSGARAKPPPRDRVAHGQKLLADLNLLRARATGIAAQRQAFQLEPRLGLTIAIKISPSGVFDFRNIEWKRDGIEVLNVQAGDGFDLVVVHVPEGRLAAFEKRIQEYLAKTTKWGPKNATLVNAIESFRSGAFDELWTEASDPPDDTEARWFQLWLRIGGRSPTDARRCFEEAVAQFGIELEEGHVPFPGRIVVAAYATRAQLERAVELLDMVAEIRGTKPTADFFLEDLNPLEQVQWVRNLEARIEDHSHNGSAYVTLLDTGVAQGHPLISQSLHPSDMFAVNPSWPVADIEGHGTAMAGLILHGNLAYPLASSDPYALHHRLESVRIFPPTGSNSPHLYGWITDLATRVVEGTHPSRRRAFAMMTTATGATTGSPSEWSATIDRLSFGSSGTLERTDDEPARRLFILSGGNVGWTEWHDYPNSNTRTPLENPAQAWNALTVGAYTELTYIDAAKWPSMKCIAAAGALAPSSTTAMLWGKGWPFKPDVVAEGGNGAIDTLGPVVGPGSVRLLTTYHDLTASPLIETGDTSAAAAEVARTCALIATRYPDYWPETVRGLVIHGARYTPEMLAALPANPNSKDKEGLVRRVGYGAVKSENALNSTAHRPTLVLQKTMVPYRKDRDGVKLNKVNMHLLPWPEDELRALGPTAVEMRVTLSYFIDPNPSQRGWQSKFRYQSHGLRFAVKAATETNEEFGQRINKVERMEAAAEDPVESMPDPDSSKWLLGNKVRSRGSVHSDVWKGTAAELASKSHLAVFPVGGWWKDWSQAERHGVEVRYSLIVSLEIADAIDVDLYTPIETQITIPTIVDISIPVA
ncbi:hypothetical protein XTPLMG728_3509 [Xanthomonas translucens pv. poae]|uniref:Peptidase S8/S53 domain-containing protein n=1 Tax=Xanthomonas graminis pv. poae TaxID=227946 RepID=A0A0K3A5I6_9XANT|nr:S8 family peptidase [Xanthomonas translucens]UKE61977.1 S8 family peptidase [Xanthomonas translucens pv. poae]CTP93088.1 hypothetical protein XTPLMG728_3509 [Xanthomonas translucens pv. poae]